MARKDKYSLATKYTAGFILSVLLTITAYIVATKGMFAGWAVLFVLLGLALVQLIVQLLFFLHIEEENSPNWNLVAFIFTLFFVTVIVVGSLWIMHNLDYNMMPKHQIDEYIMEEEAIYR